MAYEKSLLGGIFCIFAVMIIVLFLQACGSEKTQGTVSSQQGETSMQTEKQTVKYTECSQDSDCIRVRGDCCGCRKNGIDIAINSAYKNIWQKELDSKCAGTECTAKNICENWVAVCREGACKLETG